MNNRRRMVGTVTSNKMDKTVTVEVSRTYRHPFYHKVVKSSSFFKAHDELDSNIGDKVQIVESKPISKSVRWVVETIIKTEFRSEDVVEAAELEELKELNETEAVEKEAEAAVEEPGKETVEEVVEDTAEDVSVEAIEEPVKDAVEEVVEDTTEDVSVEAIEEPVKDAIE
ncbi:MAG: 30S ribosomal protein S17, partial [Anaerolineaceae bacterium]|nr:30S ribosomal protein S17 [Anaerolineaceae bacterium]